MELSRSKKKKIDDRSKITGEFLGYVAWVKIEFSANLNVVNRMRK